MQNLAPVSVNDREPFMDVLRGFAILGIFIANLNGFSWYNAKFESASVFLLPAWDAKMGFLHHMFIEGKFYSIFSLLFGWGIALQFSRAEEKGLNALPVVRRRLSFMLLLGFFHLLLWSGDIVFFYALLGFVLVRLRNISPKAMIITGAILILSPIVLYAAKSHWQWLNAPAGLMYETAGFFDRNLLKTVIADDNGVAGYFATASWWGVLKANISGMFYRYGYLFFVSRIPKVLGMFLIGYALGRSGFYNNIGQHKKLLYIIIIAGLVIGLPANYYLARYITFFMDDYWQLKTNGLFQTIAYALGVVPLALTYVAIFMLAFQASVGKKLLSFLAPVGKMAFSNYIIQTLVGSIVFLGAGLGYIRQVGPVYYSLFGIIVFAVQVLFSHAWLRYFRYGPVEWLWRSATYKKWQPMQKQLISHT